MSRPFSLALFAMVLALTGCATNSAMRAGQLAESQQDFDRAVVEYTKAVRANPNDRTVRASLEQAKIRAAQDHFTRGRRLSSIGKFEEALVELQIAAELNPSSVPIQNEMTCGAIATPRQDRSERSGQDAARDDDREEPGSAASWFGSPDRRDDARHADLPRGEQPRRVPRHWQVRQHEYPFRSDISRSADYRRSPQRVAARRPQRRRWRDAQLLARLRPAHGDRGSGHAGQAARVRGRDRPHVLSEQRRSERNGRYPAHRRRRAPHCDADRH